MLINFLFAVFLVCTVLMVILILLQQGKGADAGAAFGGGQSVLSGRSAGNLFTRLTVACAIVFFSASLLLSILYYRGNISNSVVTQTLSVMSDGDATHQSSASDIPSVPQIEDRQ